MRRLAAFLLAAVLLVSAAPFAFAAKSANQNVQVTFYSRDWSGNLTQARVKVVNPTANNAISQKAITSAISNWNEYSEYGYTLSNVEIYKQWSISSYSDFDQLLAKVKLWSVGSKNSVVVFAQCSGYWSIVGVSKRGMDEITVSLPDGTHAIAIGMSW